MNKKSHLRGAEDAEPFDRLRVIGFLPFMVSLSNHVNSVPLW